MYDTLGALYGEFDVFKHYIIDKYIGSFGLAVAEKYWGRGIGVQLLEARYCDFIF